MSRFYDPNERVPVTLDGDTIYIRAKMSVGARAAVEDEIAARGGGSRETLRLQGMGSYVSALLVHNIVAWEGPGFIRSNGTPVPCTRENILNLLHDDPLVELVRQEIAERNQPRESPDPN